ncbi:hypothetical protein E2C01_043272 [Portunus trituberculatus]|uniref:Uncharacterized protein n=1 Tax=Portunus trituberculatus TaxID=210409 RepID=A0A5B7FP16_PORTR|nr:hypothetical protein [Portunus trituberculatus]
MPFLTSDHGQNLNLCA